MLQTGSECSRGERPEISIHQYGIQIRTIQLRQRVQVVGIMFLLMSPNPEKA
jgi:hypothetical protein